jgi:hypothetical protein
MAGDPPDLHVPPPHVNRHPRKPASSVTATWQTSAGHTSQGERADPNGPEWEDLDAEDADDPMMVSEYVIEIFDYLKVVEVRFFGILSSPIH